jgi:hypothetical protein
MATIKGTFADGPLRILEVTKLQPGDVVEDENGDCLMPIRVNPSPGEMTRDMFVPCPHRTPPVEP